MRTMDSFGIILQLFLIGKLWLHVFSSCENLSEGKQADQSSTLVWQGKIFGADLAIDGNSIYENSVPSCSGTQEGTMSWWHVDLGAVVAINKIEVFGRPISPPYQLQGFQAFVSNTTLQDRTSNTLVYTNAVNETLYNLLNGHFMIEMTTKMARYVTIILDSDTAYMYGVPTSQKKMALVLCEVRVLMCDENSSLIKYIIGSTVDNFWKTSWLNAVDGDLRQNADTCRCCALSAFEYNPYVRLDFGRQLKVSVVTVYGRNDAKHGLLDTLQTLHIYIHNSPADKGDSIFTWPNGNLDSAVTTTLSPSKLGQYMTLQLEGTRYLVICEIVIQQECPAGFYDEECTNACGHCRHINDCDTKTGHCRQGCEKGYKETNLCTKACTDHFYGDCLTPCGHCKEELVCDKVTGHCEYGCASGFKNTPMCVQLCDDFTYGYNCTHSCGNCSDNSPCNKSDGHCRMCAPGYHGTLCNNTCPDYFYGNCSTPCGNCKDEVACDKATGHCEHGCASGFKNTSLCVQLCDDFTYGYNCTHSCGNCSDNSPCNKSDGHCRMCAPGYNGTLCNNTCPDYFYGNCSTPCGHCKGEVACDKATGHCEHGCASGFKNTSSCVQRFEELVDADTSPQPTVAVVVGVTAALVVAAVVIAALVFYSRRCKHSNKSAEDSGSLNTFDNVEHVPDQSILYAKPRKSRDSQVGTQSAAPAAGAFKEKIQSNTVQDKKSSKEGHEYYNFAHVANPLKLCHLWGYIHVKKADECKLFYEEFKNLKKGLVEKHAHALDPVNRGKNRYREMYAYDATRVVLEIDEEGATDYINACYIHGYERNAKFIASQGPIKDMDVDFWRMVWQQKSTMIVMLTNLHEMGGEKCKKYWPDPDETEMTFGRIKIKTDSQEYFGSFIIRRLAVSRDTETPRAVTQYHFRAWPDKDVPDTTWCLVNFWRRVMVDATGSSQEKAPIVVHCSAGIGRTGTFIALDNLYNQARTEGCLRPFQVVEALRKQRVNMVQTREQYVYLHEAVADALLIGTHHIMAEQFKDVYNFLAGSGPGSKKSRLELQYELMEESLSYQRSKLGGEGDYVYSNMLGITDSGLDADGLKITFWADHNDVNSFVVTKKPTRATQDNFWSLVEQNQIRTFVIASSLDEASDRMSSWLGTGSDASSFNVNYISKRKMDGFMEKNFSYCRKNKEESYLTTVRQFELTTWGHERAPTDPASVIRLYEGVRSWQPHLKTEEPILIYCRTGSERSGLLFTVLSLLFKFEAENENTKLNIMEKVMDVKQRDMAYIPNYVQYKFVHDVIMEHLSQKEVSEEQVYVNYQESI